MCKEALKEYLDAGGLIEQISVDTNSINYLPPKEEKSYAIDHIKPISTVIVEGIQIGVEDNYAFFIKYSIGKEIFKIICFATDITLVVEYNISNKYTSTW